MNSAIVAIGTAVPQYCATQTDLAEMVCSRLNLPLNEQRRLKAVYRATGIKHRYSVLKDYLKNETQLFYPDNHEAPFPVTSARMAQYKNNAALLGLKAIENCLSSIDSFDLHEITHIITVSCTGMYAPGIDIEIIRQLNLSTTIHRTAINFMGCYGVFNAIKIADSICSAQMNAKVLIVSVELCTLHFQNNFTVDNIISNSIFSDGAGALFIENITDSKKSFKLKNFYCDLIPDSSEHMAWHISDSGFDIVLSSYVPDIINQGILNFTQRLLKHTSLSLAHIDYFAIHPGSGKILKSCEKDPL